MSKWRVHILQNYDMLVHVTMTAVSLSKIRIHNFASYFFNEATTSFVSDNYSCMHIVQLFYIRAYSQVNCKI